MDECEILDAEETESGYFRVSWDYPGWGKLYSFMFRTDEKNHKCLYFPLTKRGMMAKTKYKERELKKMNESRKKCVIQMASMCGCEYLLHSGRDDSDKYRLQKIPLKPTTRRERKAFWLSVALGHADNTFKKMAKIFLNELGVDGPAEQGNT